MLDQFGLAAALETYLQQRAQRGGVTLHLHIDASVDPLPPEVQTICFRIAQEGFTNILRHARAQNVWVALHRPKPALELVMRDDGVGFEVEKVLQHPEHAVGLSGIQERIRMVNGEVEFKSIPGVGTELRVRLPVRATRRGRGQSAPKTRRP